MIAETKNRSVVLIAPTQMAKELGVKPSWIYRQTMEHGQGSIPRIKDGKFLRFDRHEVFNWFVSRQKGEGHND